MVVPHFTTSQDMVWFAKARMRAAALAGASSLGALENLPTSDISHLPLPAPIPSKEGNGVCGRPSPEIRSSQPKLDLCQFHL